MTARRRARPRLRGVRAHAFAKLNLALAVGPRRRDGYHDLVTVFQSISLHDTLVVRPRARGFSLRVTGNARARRGVPANSRNLVLRALRRAAEATGIDGGARVELRKQIPAGAGLGGGSSDAAAALRAWCRLYGARLGAREEAALALELGSDVPFFLRGGTALGGGRGERLRRLRLARGFRALVIVPPWSSDTARAFVALKRKKLTLTGWRAKSSVFKRLSRGPLQPEAVVGLGNTFEEVVQGAAREITSIRDRLLAGGALGARLTGSGSAVFGIFGPTFPLEPLAARFDAKRYARFVVKPTRMGAVLRPLQT